MRYGLIARLFVLLLFMAQAISPFLHAHAGGARAATGAPLHLHLTDAVFAAANPSFVPDEGRVVVAPPEVRRDDSLTLTDNPVLPVAGWPAIDRPPAYRVTVEPVVAIAGSVHRRPNARAPPAPPLNRLS